MYIWQAIKIIFMYPGYILMFLGLSIFILWFLIYLPAATIPGNDFLFQLNLLGFSGILLLALLSILTALSIVFNIYILKTLKSKKYSLSLFGQGLTGITSGIIASLFGTASCSACVFNFLGFLGFGGVVFLNEYRIPIVAVAALLLLISVYLTSKRIVGYCEVCKI